MNIKLRKQKKNLYDKGNNNTNINKNKQKLLYENEKAFNKWAGQMTSFLQAHWLAVECNRPVNALTD